MWPLFLPQSQSSGCCHAPPTPSAAPTPTRAAYAPHSHPTTGLHAPQPPPPHLGLHSSWVSQRIVLNPTADRDVFLGAAARLSLLVSLRRRKRLLVYLQMLEVIL